MLFNLYKIFSSPKKQHLFYKTLQYIFSKLPADCILRMMDRLGYHYKEICAQGKTFNETELASINADFFAIIFEIYLTTPVELQKTAISDDEYLNLKAQRLASIIQKTNPRLSLNSILRKEIKLLDIGAGDGNMTIRIAHILHAIPTGIDLEGATPDKWQSRGKLGEFHPIYYDGIHLIPALRDDTQHYTKLYDVIMFNHVLHHYPGRNAQLTGLQNAIALLKQGGVLLFSEHASILSDELIELQHVLHHFRTLLRQQDIQKLGSSLNFQRLKEFFVTEIQKYEIEKGRAHYFSRPQLEKIARVFGLKPIVVETRFSDRRYDPLRQF